MGLTWLESKWILGMSFTFLANLELAGTRTKITRGSKVNRAGMKRFSWEISSPSTRNGREASLADGVVIELKQDGRAESRMKGILLDHRVKPVRVSKYCVGLALTDPEIRAGRFRERIRIIGKQIHKAL